MKIKYMVDMASTKSKTSQNSIVISTLCFLFSCHDVKIHVESKSENGAANALSCDDTSYSCFFQVQSNNKSGTPLVYSLLSLNKTGSLQLRGRRLLQL